MKKEVLTKWNTDGELAVIYRVENILLFYLTKNDPKFKKGQKISLEEVKQTRSYKVIPYTPNNIPNDAYISVSWAWS